MGRKGKRRNIPGVMPRSGHMVVPPRVREMEPPLVVFVSSAIEGMEQERNAVRQAVESLPLARPWLFEESPASSTMVDEAYLSKVRECDIFVLVVGTLDRAAVRREYETAVAAQRRILAFVQRGERTGEFDEFVSRIPTMYAWYASAEDLRGAVRASVADEITRTYRAAIGRGDTGHLIRALSPEQPARTIRDVFGYVIFGLEAKSDIRPIVELFGGTVANVSVPAQSSKYEELVFDDLGELQRVSESLQAALSCANQSPDGRAKAFELAWQNEVLQSTSQYLVKRMTAESTDAAVTAPGLTYLVLGVHRDYAPLIRLLRPREVVEGQLAMSRDAEEWVFQNPESVQQMIESLGQAAKASDKKEAMALLLTGAMRARLSSHESQV